MRRLLNLLVLAVAAAASIATSPEGELEKDGPGWSGSASADHLSPQILTGQVYRGTVTFRGQTPGDADGVFQLRYTQAPVDFASPEMVLHTYDADGELIASRDIPYHTPEVEAAFPNAPLLAGAPFELTYVVEIEMVRGASANTMLFEASAHSVGETDAGGSLPIEVEFVGEFVDGDTGDTGDEGDTAEAP